MVISILGLISAFRKWCRRLIINDIYCNEKFFQEKCFKCMFHILFLKCRCLIILHLCTILAFGFQVKKKLCSIYGTSHLSTLTFTCEKIYHVIFPHEALLIFMSNDFQYYLFIYIFPEFKILNTIMNMLLNIN